MKSHDHELGPQYNNVIVSVTNAAFPIIPNLTVEERQQRAENDELSTTELPLFILDNSSTVDKIKEWNRRKNTPHTDLAVKRDDMRIQV